MLDDIKPHQTRAPILSSIPHSMHVPALLNPCWAALVCVNTLVVAVAAHQLTQYLGQFAADKLLHHKVAAWHIHASQSSRLRSQFSPFFADSGGSPAISQWPNTGYTAFNVFSPAALLLSCFSLRKSCRYATITGGHLRTICSHSRSSYFLHPAVMFSHANCQAASACSYLPALQYSAASAARVSLLPGARLDTFSNCRVQHHSAARQTGWPRGTSTCAQALAQSHILFSM